MPTCRLRPTPKSIPNLSLARREIDIFLKTRRMNKMMITQCAHKARILQTHSLAKIKSFCGSGSHRHTSASNAPDLYPSILRSQWHRGNCESAGFPARRSFAKGSSHPCTRSLSSHCKENIRKQIAPIATAVTRLR